MPTLEDGAITLQVFFDEKPVAGVQIKAARPHADDIETATDDNGVATVAVADAGLYSIRARHGEAKSGELNGKPYPETRHYPTVELTVPEPGAGAGPGRSWQKSCAVFAGSPIVHNGVAFFVNREGALYVINADDGKELFAKRLKGSMWATPIGNGEQVFFFERDGKVDRLSDLEGAQSLNHWTGLPEPEAATEKEKDESTGRPPASFSGSVLYAAVVTGNNVRLRRGERLFSAGLETVK